MRPLHGVMLAAAVIAASAFGVDEPQVHEAGSGSAVTAPPVTSTRPSEEARPLRGRRSSEGRERREVTPQEGPARRRGGDSRPDDRGEEPLTPEQVEQILALAREHFPGVYARLERLRQADPAAYRQILWRLRNRLQSILDAQKRDPQRARDLIEESRLQIAIADLSRKYRQAGPGPEKERIRAALADLIRKRFDLQQDRAGRDLETLRRRLDEQARRLGEREQRKELILRRELDRATGRARSMPLRESQP